MPQCILIEKAGRVTTITLNRPAVMNAVNPQMHAELQEAFDAFAADASQFICVVTGAGEKAFCAGSDLKAAVADGFDKKYPKNGYAGLIERYDLAKPVIAAVNGLALGGGFEIALACDIIIAAPHASFGLPEPLVGAVALGGGLHRLARQIGLKQAMGMVLSSRRVSAEEGARLGFVTEIAPEGELAAVTQRWCEEILRASPMAIRASKQTIMRGLDEASLADAMAHQAEYPAFAAMMRSEDLKEGARAFAEKRKPDWKGR
ncbi:MAG: enoyl-CoA hydratase-related protein [Hyphomonadaceae bacterium]